MSNRIYNQEMALEKQVCHVDAGLIIGASGAVTSYSGLGVESIVKESGAGNYTITLQDSYDKVLSLVSTVNCSAVGGSAIGSVEISTAVASLKAAIKAKAFAIQLYAPTGATYATLVKNGVTLYSKIAGVAGNAITLAVTAGATAGSEVVTVVGTAISVQVESAVSTATQMVAALAASPAAMSLVSAVASTGATAQTAYTATVLASGAASVHTAADAVSGTQILFDIVVRRSTVGPV